VREGQRGQASVEWIGLVVLIALSLATMIWGTAPLRSGLGLPGALLERMVCAVRLSEDCRDEPKLARAYGTDTARLLRAHAPALLYEPGMTALPVDYRRCRLDACAVGAAEGNLARTGSALAVTAFTHAIDCRPGAAARTEAAGADCSGERAGNLYLQFWFYYPGSATAEGSTPLKGLIRKASAALGRPSHHRDDWESYQVRIASDGSRAARASSHHGYSSGWVADRDALHVSGGSHAGQARAPSSVFRTTKDHRLRLIPLARIALVERTSFAVSPPWLKRVYRDPEYQGTD
jgi:hypothetical protein